MSRACPKCETDGEIVEMESRDPEPDVNIAGGWCCPACGYFAPYDEDDDEPPDLPGANSP